MTRSQRAIRKSRRNYIGVLLENLPSSVRGLWLSLEDILRIIHDGGAASITMSELNTIFNHSGKIKNIFTKGKFYNTTLYSYGPTSFVPGAYLKTERNRRITSDFYRYLANRKCKDLISKYEDADNQSEMTSRISSEMDNSSNWNLTEPIREKNNCSIDFTRISDLTKNKEKEKNKKNKADHDSVNDVPPKKKKRIRVQNYEY